jgi:hypothetical protein
VSGVSTTLENGTTLSRSYVLYVYSVILGQPRSLTIVLWRGDGFPVHRGELHTLCPGTSHSKP